MAVNISALAVWAARTMAATVAVSLMLWDMLPPRVFPVRTFAESAMVGTDPRPDRVAARRRPPCRTLTDWSTVACPKLNVKPGKGWTLIFRVHVSVRSVREELGHRLLQPRTLQVARDEDDAGAAIRSAPARQRRRRMDQMLNAMDRDRRIRARDV